MKLKDCIQKRLCSGIAAAALLLVPVFAQSQVKPQITQTVDLTQRKALPGTVHPLANSANDRGRVDGGLKMTDMLLMLQPSKEQAAALKKYVDNLHNPTSPTFHQWLTPEQYASQFGAHDADVRTVSNWLGSSGFAVEQVSRGKNWIRFSGNAAQVEKAFQTQIHQYSIQSATQSATRYANATGLSIPAALAPAVSGVVSMNNFLSSPQHTALGKITRNDTGKLVRVADNGAVNPAITSPGSQVETFLMPGDFSTIYDAKSVVASGTDGSGISIAVVGRSDISMSDVESFRTIAGLPFNDPNVIYATTDPGVVPGDDVEASLDVEWAGAIAPKAKINYVIGASTGATDGVDIASSYIVDHVTSPIMTVSFGLCEADMSDTQISFYHLLWQQAAAEGITVFVSSGDAGASGCNSPGNPSTVSGFGVNGLASTPYNVAVGGTEFNDPDLNTYWDLNNSTNLSSAKGYIPEAVWNESCAGRVAPSLTNCNFAPYQIGSFAAGGGASSCATRTTDDFGDEFCAAGYSKPSWQIGAGVPQDNVRDIPDVSLAAAGEHDGYIFCVQGVCQWTTNSDGSILLQNAAIVGGTSASAPSMASIMALVEQRHGQFQGVANYQFYKLAAAQQSGSCDASKRTDPTQNSACIFNDVTLGSNAVPCFQGGQDCQGTDQPVQVGRSLPPPIFPPNSFMDGQNATASYDLGAGLGSVDVANLLNAWGDLTTASSTTTLSLSQTTFQHGTSITLSGKVSPASGSGNPSGEVLITSSTAGALQSDPVTSGAFSGSSIDLPGGSSTLVAQYSGDATYGPSKSAPIAITVTPESSTLTGTSFALSPFLVHFTRRVVQLSATPLGNPFWLQFQVNGASGSSAATGTIKLSQNGKVFGTYPVDKTGLIYVQCGPDTQCDFGPGDYTFQADYSGDSSFNPSTGTLPFTINKGLAKWATAANIITPVAGTQVIGSVIFTLADPANPPTGTVALTRGDTGDVLGTGTIDKTGTATIPFNAPSGEYALVANYAGDDNYDPFPVGTTQSIRTTDFGGTKTVNIGLNVGTGSFSLGQHTQVSVKVAPAQSGATGMPIGFVTLYSGNGQVSGNLLLSGGTASGVVEWDRVGTQSVYAVYSGDGIFTGGNSTAINVVVAQAVPTVTVQPLAGYVAVGGQASVTANLSSPLSATNAPAPTGAIQFFDSVNGAAAQPLGTSQVVTTGNGGVLLATLAPALPQGSNVITAVYSGDANWKSTTSAPSTPILVTTSDYTIAAPTGPEAVTAGEVASIPITTQSILGYIAPITLICGGPLPEGVTCNSATVVPGTNGAVTLTTTAPGTTTGSAKLHNSLWAISGTVSLAGLFLLCLPKRRYFTNLAVTLLAIGMVSGLAGCGSSSVKPTNMTLTSSNTKVASGTSVTLQATVQSENHLKGNVVFSNGSTVLGTVSPVNGIATLQVSSLSVGTHAITAKYSGDGANSASASSDLLEQTVTGTFTLVVNATSGTLSHTVNIPVTLQ